MGDYKRAFAEIFEQANEKLQSVCGGSMQGGICSHCSLSTTPWRVGEIIQSEKQISDGTGNLFFALENPSSRSVFYLTGLQ